jgi:hypothetical protein
MRLSAFTPLSGLPVIPMMSTLPMPTASGWAGSPLIASWSQKVQAGQPVTIDEHNAVVAQLAFCRTILAQPGPLSLPVLPAQSTAGRDPSRPFDLVLGATAFEPRTTAPQPVDTSPVLGVIAAAPSAAPLSDLARREWCTVAEGAGAKLRLEPEMIVSSTAPGGYIPAGAAFLAAIPAMAYLTVGFVAAAGVFAFAAYRGYTNESAAETQRVRIRYDAAKAQSAERDRVALEAVRARHEAQARNPGAVIAPSPLETPSPVVNPNEGRPPAPMFQGALDALKEGLITIGGYGALALGFTAIVGVGERALARREMRRTMGAL